MFLRAHAHSLLLIELDREISFACFGSEKAGDVWVLHNLKGHKEQNNYFKKSFGEGLYRSFFYVLKCGSFRLRVYSPPRLPAANDASERRR